MLIASHQKFEMLSFACAGPTAAQYFAAYLDNARIVKLHFEDFHCEEPQLHRDVDRCLREEYVRSDSHYQLARTYFGRCGN